MKLADKTESAAKPTVQAVRYGEDLMEALDKAHNFLLECESYKI